MWKSAAGFRVRTKINRSQNLTWFLPFSTRTLVTRPKGNPKWIISPSETSLGMFLMWMTREGLPLWLLSSLACNQTNKLWWCETCVVFYVFIFTDSLINVSWHRRVLQRILMRWFFADIETVFEFLCNFIWIHCIARYKESKRKEEANVGNVGI